MTATTSKPTIKQMRAFLKARYKHDRFEGRDGTTWGENYSLIVAQSHLDDLIANGYGFISKFESATGQVVKYSVLDVVAV